MVKRVFFACVALVAASGCMTVTLKEGEKPQATARNFGWTLFGFVPLVCGNAETRSKAPFTFFWNDTAPARIERTLARAAVSRDMKVKRMASRDDGTVFFAIPQCAFMLPIPYLVTYRDVTVTAELVTDAELKAAERAKRLKREMEELLETVPTN